MHKILLVEDEKKIRQIIEKYLVKDAFEVYAFETGEEALAIFQEENFDLIILDRMLPGLSGDEVIENIRKTSDIPIIMVTAKVEESDIIEGFKYGADDYIVKPFSPQVLIERVKAILRRARHEDKTNVISYNNGELLINLDSYSVDKGKETIEFTKNEFEIIKVLFKNPNKIFTREEIISSAFGSDYDAFDRAIDTHIKNIRQKLEDDSRKPKYILTVYGIGYKVGDDN